MPTALSRPLQRSFDEFDQIMDRVLQSSDPHTLQTRESDDAFHVEMDLPGFRREDLTLEVHDGLLSLHAEVTAEEDRQYRKTEKKLRLPELIDPAGIEARLENGVLRLKLPKRAEDRPRRIEVF